MCYLCIIQRSRIFNILLEFENVALLYPRLMRHNSNPCCYTPAFRTLHQYKMHCFRVHTHTFRMRALPNADSRCNAISTPPVTCLRCERCQRMTKGMYIMIKRIAHIARPAQPLVCYRCHVEELVSMYLGYKDTSFIQTARISLISVVRSPEAVESYVGCHEMLRVHICLQRHFQIIIE